MVRFEIFKTFHNLMKSISFIRFFITLLPSIMSITYLKQE